MKIITAEEVYDDYKDLKKEDVQAIQEWMRKQNHLPNISELKIMFFLHASYYKIEPAKTYIENYYTLRANWLEFSQNRDINSETLRHAMRTALVTVLPIRTKHNHIIVYTRLMDFSLDHFDVLQQLKYFDMGVSALFRTYGLTDGQVAVMDIEGATFGHLLRMNLMDLKRMIYYVQEALPVRLKGLHYINVSPVGEKLLSMIKPLMNKGMASLLHSHSKMETLYEYVPKEALPKELGGEAGTFKELQDQHIKLIEENAQYLIDEEVEIADETKRIGKSKDQDALFGIEGSFKKLDFD